MNKPQPLVRLLDELRDASAGTTVVTIGSSSAAISLAGEVDDLTLSPEECELLFDSPDSVQQLCESLNNPDDAVLELRNLSVDPEVMDALTEAFSSVDEV